MLNEKKKKKLNKTVLQAKSGVTRIDSPFKYRQCLLFDILSLKMVVCFFLMFSAYFLRFSVRSIWLLTWENTDWLPETSIYFHILVNGNKIHTKE